MLNLDIKANLAYNKNKVTEVPNELIRWFYQCVIQRISRSSTAFRKDIPSVTSGATRQMAFSSRRKKLTITSIQREHFLQKGAKPGDVRRIDENGDGKINDHDKVMLGNPNPDYIYGFSLAADYHGFDFSMNLTGCGR